MRNKSIVIILFLISLVAIAHTTVPIEVFTEPDPPSVYNMAGGGLSGYYYDNVLRSEVISEIDDITRRNPGEYALIIPGSGKILTPSPGLFEWVEKGGIIIVMDESLHITPLLDRLGLIIERSLSSIDRATCNVNDKVINVTFNVYVVLKAIKDHRGDAIPICFINSEIVAWRVQYGKGIFYIIGDSSIVINEMLVYQKIASDNLLFLNTLIQGRKIAFYDSFTRRETTTLEKLLGVLSWFVSVITHATLVVKEQDLLTRTMIYIVLSVIPTSLLFVMISELELTLKDKRGLLKLDEVLNQVKQKLSKYHEERST